ncbi:MAG: hypothetical protein ABEI77_08470 [Halorientalis sp.]
MRRETALIILVIAVVLMPMWYLALASGTEHHGIGLGTGGPAIGVNTTKSGINPTGTFIPRPTEVSPNQAGVISWVALFVLVAFLVSFRKFVDRIGESPDRVIADGGGESAGTDRFPSYMTRGTRRIIEYWPAEASKSGLYVIAVLSWTTVLFAGLLILEGIGKARTQFIGIYAFMLFVSLAMMATCYYAYFIPAVTVAEERHLQDDHTEET